MVEYQVGCSDISQSKEANVTESTNKSSPSGEMERIFAVSTGSPERPAQSNTCAIGKRSRTR